MDRWYALQVTTGAEGDVKTRLDRLAYLAMLPMKIMRERRNGRWRDETKVMLPGYLFVQAAMTAADWHRIRRLPGVLRILGGDRPSPLSDDETARIQWLDNGGTPWALSEFRRTEAAVGGGGRWPERNPKFSRLICARTGRASGPASLARKRRSSLE